MFFQILQVIEEPSLKVLYTTEERYTVKRSFYSGNIITSNSAVPPSQYLTITVDAKLKQQLEQQIQVTERHMNKAGSTAQLFSFVLTFHKLDIWYLF